MGDSQILQNYQSALVGASGEGQIRILQGLGISSLSRMVDISAYIPLLHRPNNTEMDYQSDFELLKQVPSQYHSELQTISTRKELINRVKRILSDSEHINSNQTSVDSEYETCLEEARPRHDRGNLKLCPEGYCTAKSKFEVYPSAYANAYAAQVCKGTKPDLLGNSKNYYGNQPKPENSGLTRWFEEEWVNVCSYNQETGTYEPCGRSKAKLDPKDYPYCRPLNSLPGTTIKTVSELTSEEKQNMCALKRSLPQGVGGEPTRVYV